MESKRVQKTLSFDFEELKPEEKDAIKLIYVIAYRYNIEPVTIANKISSLIAKEEQNAFPMCIK